MEREDYFFGTPQNQPADRVYAIVIYDIVENKKRVKFAKFMNGYGNRVQKSCFEVMLTKSTFNKMINEIPKYCKAEDSVRVYKINGRSEVHKWGQDLGISQEEIIFV